MNSRWKNDVMAVAILVVPVSLFLALVLFACGNDEQRSATRHSRNFIGVTEIEREMVFFKHQKTGLCFAYAWGGGGYGGPALAHVPCEAVGLK